MSRGLAWFSGFFALIVIATIAMVLVVRSSDGPMEILTGGPFQSGEFVTDVEDWSFLDQQMTIEMQTMVPPSSRTLWLVVYDNRPIVLSAYMNSAVGKIWKQWPKKIAKDNRAIVRSEGKLYRFTLERLYIEEDTQAILDKFNQRYDTPITTEDITTENTWLFELKPAS